jgi:hypothetical protein
MLPGFISSLERLMDSIVRLAANIKSRLRRIENLKKNRRKINIRKEGIQVVNFS